MGKQTDPEDRRKAVDRIKAGVSTITKEAKRYGVTRNAIYKWLEIAGVKPPPLPTVPERVEVAAAPPVDAGRPTEAPGGFEEALKAAGIDAPKKKPEGVVVAGVDPEARMKCISFLRDNTNMVGSLLVQFAPEGDKDIARKYLWTKEREAAVEPYAVHMWAAIERWADLLGKNAAALGFLALGVSYLPPTLEWVGRASDRKKKAREEEERKRAADVTTNNLNFDTKE